MLRKRQSGYSLIELSIVLVIVGLLVGGVMVGHTLIKAAELRAVTTEFAEWQAAVNTFRQKYSQYPGDFDAATQVWGEDTCPAAVGSVLSATCDGNGDGVIAQHDASTQEEHYLFWQHLMKAGLVEGTYTGVRGAASPWKHVAGENAPVSEYPGGGWAVDSNSDHDDIIFIVDTTNALVFGAPGTWESMYDPLLTPEQAWNVDIKIDDGLPGSGNVNAVNRGLCTDADDEYDFESEYRLSEDGARCGLYFRNGL